MPRPIIMSQKEDSIHRGDYIVTVSGKKFYPLAPRAEEIELRDVAHSLANQCRFTGHTSEFYSVAEHSVRVSLMLEYDPTLAMWGLMHDASEAYLTDLAAPVKRSPIMVNYRVAESALMRQVAQRFSLPYPIPDEVKHADAVMLHTEAASFFPEDGTVWWDMSLVTNTIKHPLTPKQARDSFLTRYRALDIARRQAAYD